MNLNSKQSHTRRVKMKMKNPPLKGGCYLHFNFYSLAHPLTP